PVGEVEDLGGDYHDDDAGAGVGGDAGASAGAGSLPSAARSPGTGPDRATIDRLRAEVGAAETRARKELEDARADADRWDQRRVLAERKGDAALAGEAAREADRKRARMHTALEELGRLTAEKERLAKIAPAAPRPSVDDLLAGLKQR